MAYRWRKRQTFFVLLILVLIIWYRHEPAQELQFVTFVGQTMGTTYSIKYWNESGISHKEQVDSVLQDFNLSLSTYIPDSEVSRFNEQSILKFSDPYFYPVLKKSKEIFEKSEGAFDPTVGPLIRVWGFGNKKIEVVPDSAVMDSLLTLVGFHHISFDSISVCKLKKNVMINFNAVAKGYGVDVVADYLKGKGVKDLFVEIGGEVVTAGSNNDEAWRIGIEVPAEGVPKSDLQAILSLKDGALATSGNYRSYWEKDGRKYAHTLNPYTGYPVQHSLISASVLAGDCITADAWATAFMVLGVEKAKEIIEKEDSLEAYLVYAGEDGEWLSYMSSGIKDKLAEVNG